MIEYIVSETKIGAIKTLQEAFSIIKGNENNFPFEEIVNIKIDGLLHLDKTISITNEMLPENPIIIEGANTNSGFSGGIKITDFSLYKDNIWCAKVPEVEYTRDLYIDGKFAKRTSTPHRKSEKWYELEGDDFEFWNLPDEEVKMVVKSSFGNEPKTIRDPSGIATTNTEILGWRNPRDIEMIFEAGWVHRIVPIESVMPLDNGKVYIKPIEPAFHSAIFANGVTVGCCPNYIENVFELLGNPLEWYFDRNEKMLYIGFGEGDSPCNHEIIIPVIEQIIDIKGNLDRKPKNITFKNLTFSHTTWLKPNKYGFPEIQATVMEYIEIPKELIKEKPYEADYSKVISAIRVVGADSVNFHNCTFTNLGTGALQYEFGTQNSKITNNKFFCLGGSAITMGDFILERAHHPEDKREIVKNNEFSNNLIYNIGENLNGAAAVLMGYVQNITVAHNYIHDVPYTGISLGWGWGNTDVSVGPKRPTKWKTPTVCSGNKILYNHIHKCMQKLHDGGAIYTLGRMDGTEIIGNYIHESHGFKGDGYDKFRVSGYQSEEIHDPASDKFFALDGIPGGIYLDEGSAGITVAHNLVHDVPLPILYHNQIDYGYKMINHFENYLNVKPTDENFPKDIAEFAGILD